VRRVLSERHSDCPHVRRVSAESRRSTIVEEVAKHLPMGGPVQAHAAHSGTGGPHRGDGLRLRIQYANALSMLSPRVWRRRTHRCRQPSLPALVRSAPHLLTTASTRDIGGPTYLRHPYFSIASCKCSEGTSPCPLSTHPAPPRYAILL
jgi:hypothetical protein